MKIKEFTKCTEYAIVLRLYHPFWSFVTRFDYSLPRIQRLLQIILKMSLLTVKVLMWH